MEQQRLRTDKQNLIRRKRANLPSIKTVEGFDFGFQRSISKEQMLRLSDMTWVEQAFNVCFLGPPGIGKTHLAVSLAVKALDLGYAVAFITLIGYLYRIDSERKLEQEIKVNIAYCWYLGLDLEDNVPTIQLFHKTDAAGLKAVPFLKRYFLQVIRYCVDLGLVTGQAIAMDSTHVRANIDNNKQETVIVTEPSRKYLAKIEAEVSAGEAEMYDGKSRCGPKSREKSGVREREEVKSLTDPDSGLLGRPGKPRGFHYLYHQSADADSGIITDIHVTAGNRTDHGCCVERIRKQWDFGLPIHGFVADKSYDIIEIHHLLGEMGISVYTPESLAHEWFSRNAVTAEQFVFDKEKGIFCCPGGETLHFFLTLELEINATLIGSRNEADYPKV